MIRHHTLVVAQDEGFITGCMLEKDWYSGAWCDLFDFHMRVARKQGIFHIVGQGERIAPEQASMLIDRAITGQILTIDLKQYSVDKRFFTRGRGAK